MFNKKVTYSADLLICDYKDIPFVDGIGAIKESFQNLKEFGIHTDGTNPNQLKETLVCCPIKIAADVTDPNEDWCRFGAPISGFYEDNIVEFLPKKWLQNPDGSWRKKLQIIYPDFVISIDKVIVVGKDSTLADAFAHLQYESPIKNEVGEEMETIANSARFVKDNRANDSLVDNDASQTTQVVVETDSAPKPSADKTKKCGWKKMSTKKKVATIVGGVTLIGGIVAASLYIIPALKGKKKGTSKGSSADNFFAPY